MNKEGEKENEKRKNKLCMVSVTFVVGLFVSLLEMLYSMGGKTQHTYMKPLI